MKANTLSQQKSSQHKTLNKHKSSKIYLVFKILLCLRVPTGPNCPMPNAIFQSRLPSRKGLWSPVSAPTLVIMKFSGLNSRLQGQKEKFLQNLLSAISDRTWRKRHPGNLVKSLHVQSFPNWISLRLIFSSHLPSDITKNLLLQLCSHTKTNKTWGKVYQALQFPPVNG
jgi:hypothetical protein